MNRLTKWLAVLALVASVGGHWALLQGVAWATMVARFSQSMPLGQALAYTFDGRHPCQLCLAVQHGQQGEQKESKLNPAQKLTLFLNLPSGAFLLQVPTVSVFVFSEHPPLRPQRPLLPPPKVA